jgi:3-deoxy-D-manno-oct-2-ulosonic acid (Kdo) hydroxylase
MNQLQVDRRFRARVLTLDPSVDLSAQAVRDEARETVECGGVVFLRGRGFRLTPEEQRMISNPGSMLVNYQEPERPTGRPTIIYDPARRRLYWHFSRVQGKLVSARVQRSKRAQVEAMLASYCDWAEETLGVLFPSYAPALLRDRVTYRPFSRDSTQSLHMDATYGFPTEGRGMLRLFCNVHPESRVRAWQVGEPFEPFAKRFLGSVQPRNPRFMSVLASRLGLTGGRPTVYDRLMMDIKRASARDKEYQRTAPREVLEFPSGSGWIALTDVVLHGGVSGQHSLDQTWFLPVEAMRDPSRSSLRILERLTGQPLV